MDCDFIAKYQVKIIYDGAMASGVIIKLNEFLNHFFVFTVKHTFGDNSIDIDKVKVLYQNKPINVISFITLKVDIVIFVFENLEELSKLEPIDISKTDNKFKECAFSGYPNNVDNDFCERAKYHQKVNQVDNLYRILPEKNTDSFNKKGLSNSKGYSGSGLFIKSSRNYELVGIIKEHETDKSAFHYIALASLKNEIVNKIAVECRISNNKIIYNKKIIGGITLKTVPVKVDGKVLNVSVVPVSYAEYNSYCKDIDKSFTFLKGYEDEPIGKISWDDAYQYCQWLGSKIDKECNLINSKNWKIISLNHHIKVDENISEWCEDGNENERKLKMGSHFELVDMKLKTLKISFRYNIIN
jgi:hypothetical protein